MTNSKSAKNKDSKNKRKDSFINFKIILQATKISGREKEK